MPNTTPTVTWARPRDARVAWQAYLSDKIKVRELHSGVVQYATDDGDWQDA